MLYELLAKNSGSLLTGLYETQMIGAPCVSELNSDCIMTEVKDFMLRMKNNGATGHHGMIKESQTIFVCLIQRQVNI
jgi:hypothetical protein